MNNQAGSKQLLDGLVFLTSSVPLSEIILSCQIKITSPFQIELKGGGIKG